MRLHYDAKMRRSLGKGNNMSYKDKQSYKDLGQRSNSRKKDESGKRLTDHEIRFLQFKNENRNSFKHLYQNYFGFRSLDSRKGSTANKLGENSRDAGTFQEKGGNHKHRSFADLKSHFNINKNELSGCGNKNVGGSMAIRGKLSSIQGIT